MRGILFGLFLFIYAYSIGQTYHWTGNAGDNDFYNVLNWEDSISGSNPASGVLNQVIADIDLFIGQVGSPINADQGIQFLNASLRMENATLNAIFISGGSVNLGHDAYINLVGDNPLKDGLKINIVSAYAWVKIHKLNPQTIFNDHLGVFSVNQSPAVYKTNLRIDNYYTSGSVVRSNSSETGVLTLFDKSGFKGDSVELGVNTVYSGIAIPALFNNKTLSFKLKRGFMLTLADNDDGTGISKNYIASEEDLNLTSLPSNLRGHVSFLRVVPWNWVSKKGVGGNVTGLNETWHYNWSNIGNSTLQRENVPMSWGKGGADDPSDIVLYKSKYKTAHVLAFNESDNCEDQSGQYGNLCITDVAVATYENLMKTGLRLVSPSGRENAPFGWLKEFYDKATAQNIRIDVIGVHWYDWGNNPKNSPNADPNQVFNRFKKYLQDVHNLYGLPIWITEFNANPNRTTAVNKAFMELALPYLESLEYVERYAWFEPSSDVADYYLGGSYTEVGLFYKNFNSTPSIPQPSYQSASNLDQNMNDDLVAIWSDEAENGIFGGGTVLKTGCANASGTEFISLEAGTSATLTFGSVNIQTPDFYYLTIYHFNANDIILNISVNGVATQISLMASNWCFQGAPGKTTVQIDLQSGLNELQFYETDGVSILLDRFELFGTVSTNVQNPFVNKAPFYPNPADRILLFNNEQAVSHVRLYDLNGKSILDKQNVKELDVSAIDPGVYIIQINAAYFKFMKR